MPGAGKLIMFLFIDFGEGGDIVVPQFPSCTKTQMAVSSAYWQLGLLRGPTTSKNHMALLTLPHPFSSSLLVCDLNI